MGVVAATLAACGGSNSAARDGRLDVVANFYPVAYAVERVGGDLVDVRNLTRAGVEPHDLELTSDEVDRIENADVVLYVGSGFQPGVEAVAKRRDGDTVDVARGLLRSGDAAALAVQEGEKAEVGARDAHFWLDPTLMSEAVARVRLALVNADPDNAPAYERNARAYQEELRALDANFESALAQCAGRQIVTAHAAFYYLADRYHLTQYAIAGVEPESEPDPQHFADLADIVRRDGITTIFYEDLVPRDFADTLARETGARTAVLSPLEGLSDEEQANGETYLTVMRGNLAALTTALACPPPPAAA